MIVDISLGDRVSSIFGHFPVPNNIVIDETIQYILVIILYAYLIRRDQFLVQFSEQDLWQQ